MKVRGGQSGPVAVYGATGHTGRFVVDELLRRGRRPIAVARSAEALASARLSPAVVRRNATVDDPDSLDEAFRGAAAIINCAGPFLDTAAPVAASAVRLGAHYLDVTAEQPSAEAVLDSFDGPARAAGVAVLPAVGFYGGFADLLATAAAGDWKTIDNIEVMIGLDSWHPTPGTRLTGARNTAPRRVLEERTLVPVRLPPQEREWRFADPIGLQPVLELPFCEIILIGRHLRPRTLHTYLSTNALRDIRDASTPTPVVDESGRSPQQFAVEVVVESKGQVRRAVAKGRDIYAFSAPLICEVLERLLSPRFDKAGTYAPGELPDTVDVLKSLQPEHLLVQLFDG